MTEGEIAILIVRWWW